MFDDVLNIKMYKKRIDYDGSQLRSHFIRKMTKVNGDALFGFLGNMDVRPEKHMVDLEDVENDDGIYSDLALQFIIEHFGCSLELAIYRQRLFMFSALHVLNVYSDSLHLEGDDLMHYTEMNDAYTKLSVSIATVSPVSALIHVGINVQKVPKDRVKVDTISLGELHDDFKSTSSHELDRNRLLSLGDYIGDEYRRNLILIKEARSKVIAVP